MAQDKRAKQGLISIITPLNFVEHRQTKHGVIFKNHEKNISYQIQGSASNTNWINDAKRQLHKLIDANFYQEELKTLLNSLIKKHKIRFNKQGKTRILRKSIKLNELEDFQKKEGFAGLLDAMIPEEDELFEKVKKIIEEKRK